MTADRGRDHVATIRSAIKERQSNSGSGDHLGDHFHNIVIKHSLDGAAAGFILIRISSDRCKTQEKYMITSDKTLTIKRSWKPP